MTTCRECNRKAKWVLTNITISRHPFLCGIHARKSPYSTMFKMGYTEQDNSVKR